MAAEDGEISEGKYQEMMGLVEDAGFEGRELLTTSSIWITRDGRRVAVRDMDDNHLLNTIRCFRDKSPHGTRVFPRDPVRRREWLNLLANEAYSRGLTLEEVDEKDPVHE